MSQTQALRVKIPTFGYGDRLRRIRQDQDLGQRVFAASLGMTASTYARHELLDEVPRGARLVANSIQLVYGIPAWWVLGQPSPEECAVRLLGHASPTTTARYVLVDDDRAGRVVRGLHVPGAAVTPAVPGLRRVAA